MVAMGEGQKEDRKGGGLRENDKSSSESENLWLGLCKDLLCLSYTFSTNLKVHLLKINE